MDARGLALDLGPGDWLWTTPVTFVASANCGLYCGAQVDFVDIDPRTYNLCPNALKAKLQAAEKAGKLPKVLVAVHLCGQPCDMAAIHALGQKYGFKIIEDASHAIGGKYKGEFIGNSRYSDITVFSFHPVKIITTAEGGQATTTLQGKVTGAYVRYGNAPTNIVAKRSRGCSPVPRLRMKPVPPHRNCLKGRIDGARKKAAGGSDAFAH